MLFPEFPDSSRVWVYTADRPITVDEQDRILPNLKSFIAEWAAHGAQLFGDAAIIDNNFIVLVVDESQTGASGCSIDTSVRYIKELGNQLNINFFDRLNMVIKEDDEFSRVHIADLRDHMTAKVYNPMITTLGELRNNWIVPVESSPFV